MPQVVSSLYTWNATNAPGNIAHGSKGAPFASGISATLLNPSVLFQLHLPWQNTEM